MELLDTQAEVSANAIRLVNGVTGEQWGIQTPCAEWDVRQLVNHMTGTTLLFQACAARQAPSHDMDNDLLGDSPAASFAEATGATGAAWRQEGALDGMVSIPAEMPAMAALGVNVIDIGTHCWDLAQATGQDHGLSASLIETIDHWNHQIVSDEVRAGGGFGAILESANDDALTQMLAFVGRTG